LVLVFEKHFDDGFYLIVNSMILKARKIQTIKKIGLRLETITIDHSSFKEVTKVSLTFELTFFICTEKKSM